MMRNKIITIVLVVSAVLLTLGLYKNGNFNSSSIQTETSETINSDMSAVVDNLDQVIKNVIERQSTSDLVLLDVRTGQEWDVEHAKGAVLWGNAAHLSKGEMPNIDKDAEIYVYCRSGNRAGQAIKAMQDAGFTNLTNIRGLSDWKDAGGETEFGE